MSIAGWVAVAIGALLSIAVLWNDIRAARATGPYEGKKLGPELHVIAGILTGIGSGLLLGLWPGLGIGTAHAVAAFAAGAVLYRL